MRYAKIAESRSVAFGVQCFEIYRLPRCRGLLGTERVVAKIAINPSVRGPIILLVVAILLRYVVALGASKLGGVSHGRLGRTAFQHV